MKPSLLKVKSAPIASFFTSLLPYRRSKISDEQWEEEYASGHWEYVKTLEQLARYRVIAGYCDHFAPGGAFLDIGCGEGYLREIVAPSDYSRYVGIDLSAKAIDKAKRLEDEKTEFFCADVDDWSAEERFDIVVFNESLYYLKQPLSVLDKYWGYLKECGIFIISMHGLRPWNRRLWKLIEARYETIDEVSLRHGSGKRWIVKAVARPGWHAPKGKSNE